MNRLWRFAGGLRLAGHKRESVMGGVRQLPTPKRVVLPLQQHVGAPAEPVVQVGQTVCKGELLARAESFVSAPVHASVSGTVVAIDNYAVPHPSGIAEPCVVIESDGEERWWPDLKTPSDPATQSAEKLRELIRAAGVVGLGGAVFPSAAKLGPPRPVDTLVINGVECEPYITCDDTLMRSRPDDVVRGSAVLRRIVAAQRCLIAVEDNKPEALARLRAVLATLAGELDVSGIEVVSVPTVFPTGGEKQLIKVLTGREVPVGGLPYEVGCVCLNVGTAAAVHDAVYTGRPLLSRLVTVTGPGVRHPDNFEVPLGTSVSDLLAAAGGVTTDAPELIMGGPMMGFSLPGEHLPITKASNCILVRTDSASKPAMPCIRCGSCASACPMQLLPQQLYWHARGREFDKLTRYHLNSCIECGCCNAVCPSHIPLVDYFRFAKSEIADQAYKRERANESRIRNQQRTERLEAARRAAEERKAKRKAGRKRAAEPAPDAAASAVREAS